MSQFLRDFKPTLFLAVLKECQEGTGYSMNVIQQNKCLVVNTIIDDNFAGLFISNR